MTLATVLWGSGFAPFTGLGLHKYLLDMAALIQDLHTHPGDFGVSNVNWPCAGFTFALVPGTGCCASAFSDVLHPSALVHHLFAQAALDVLGIPEPDTLALFAMALLGWWWRAAANPSLAVRCNHFIF